MSIKPIFAAVIVISALLPAPAAVAADTPGDWTLQQCIDYAQANNISLKSSRLQAEQTRVDVVEARDAFLPQLSANASQGFNFGRGLTANNTYADHNTSSFQWGASFSLPLFQGLSGVRNLRLARASLDQALQECEATKDDITLNVTSQYLQVLYSREIVASAVAQLEYSTYEVERQQALFEAGKIAEAVLYDARALQAQDSLQLVAARGDAKAALISLANLLQLRPVDNFDVAPIDDDPDTIEIPGPDIVYSSALAHNNSMLAARKAIDAASSAISLARTGYIPRLSFEASVGSTYYTLAGSDNPTFSTQMRNNFSTYLGFHLSIPIFDRFSTRNSITRARLRHTAAVLDADRRESDLYQAVTLAYTQADASRSKYRAAVSALEATRLSFEAIREKYNLGRATPAEFEQAKNNLFRLEVSLTQARYDLLLRARILRFYQTNTI